jgi:hypothetical protein
MSFYFQSSDFDKIGKILDVTACKESNMVRFEIKKQDKARHILLEVYTDIQIGKTKGNLISVYTTNTHLQLHFCSGYVFSDILGEITFFSESNNKVSGLIIEKEGGCSFFSNVDKETLSGDFSQLAPEVMMSSIALSLMETTLTDEEDSEKRN